MNEPTVNITDEHLTKLDIQPDTILVFKVSDKTTQEDILRIVPKIKTIIKDKIGLEPVIVVMAGDSKLETMTVEELVMMKDRINTTLIHINSENNGTGR